jgi:hypothetical protein
MREAVQQGGGHLRVAEHTRPFSEVQIRRDHHAGVPVQGCIANTGARAAAIFWLAVRACGFEEVVAIAADADKRPDSEGPDG